MKKDEQLFEQHKNLVEQIRNERSLQPSERNNKGFYATKRLFLEYGLVTGTDTTIEHKLWRDRGMHEYMRRILLELFNNLNPGAEYRDIDKTIENGTHKRGTKYPEVSWEHLECYAASRRVQELREEAINISDAGNLNKSNEANSHGAGQEYLSLDELVQLRCSRSTGSNRRLTRETLEKHCRDLRAKCARGEMEIPCPLYTSRSDLADIEIVYIPPRGTSYKFRKIRHG